MKQNFQALILAAGRGTRFKSETIKVLHPLLGKSILWWVVDAAARLKPEKIHIVVGYQKESIMQEAFPFHVDYIVQEDQKGVAYAVKAAESTLKKCPQREVLILHANFPLIRAQTLKSLLNRHRKAGNALTYLAAESESFSASRPREKKGAIERDKEDFQVCVFTVKELLGVLPRIFLPNNEKPHLSDVAEILSAEGKRVGIHRSRYSEDLISIHDRFDLCRTVNTLRFEKLKSLAKEGVTIYDPSSTWIDWDVRIGRDTIVYPSVIIEGKSSIGRQCIVYPSSHIIDSRIGNRVWILGSTTIEKSVLADDVRVGPFSHLRQNTSLRQGAKVGNFVEMKNSVFGKNSKAMHLSYIGDSEVEGEVNIGAGTITCNFDGKKKHKTLVKEGVFVGSGTQLVAPVKIGKGAFIGAGSTITKDVSPKALAVARAKQIEKKNWARGKTKR